ncbi:hypothetical protein BDQ12DRAFT_684709 [Crucibulum laeve]|uniref:non-specific serine/threonine protein kinase n=1 Tax=Crucibulum laeve TaxID=68775 RepID=A0A5C3M0E8_9AGAR|nr:hypothetical protein BDQ12DRAFT_684709 [Crucibulum laeve]
MKLLQRLITSTTPPFTHHRPLRIPRHPLELARIHSSWPLACHLVPLLLPAQRPNGTHVCMVLEALDKHLLELIKRHQNKGEPMPLVKQIAKLVLLALDYLHRCCGVIRTGEYYNQTNVITTEDCLPHLKLCLNRNLAQQYAVLEVGPKFPQASLSRIRIAEATSLERFYP